MIPFIRKILLHNLQLLKDFLNKLFLCWCHPALGLAQGQGGNSMWQRALVRVDSLSGLSRHWHDRQYKLNKASLPLASFLCLLAISRSPHLYDLEKLRMSSPLHCSVSNSPMPPSPSCRLQGSRTTVMLQLKSCFTCPRWTYEPSLLLFPRKTPLLPPCFDTYAMFSQRRRCCLPLMALIPSSQQTQMPTFTPCISSEIGMFWSALSFLGLPSLRTNMIHNRLQLLCAPTSVTMVPPLILLYSRTEMCPKV